MESASSTGMAAAGTEALPADREAPQIELSVVVPTYNEVDNVETMVDRLAASLGPIRWEVIFVDDDSPDGTAERARDIATRDPRVRCLQRVGRRGLSSACIEGLMSSSAPFLAVIDGDLQHDETRLPEMLERLRGAAIDIVVGSRYVEGGGIGEWDQRRAAVSRIATRLSRSVLKADLTDPMSGFFMISRQAFHRSVRRMSGIGFKILLDVFASSPEPLRFEEIPYRFRLRQEGESKLDAYVAWEHLMLLADKALGRFVPARFVAFTLVGGLGVLVHLGVLSGLFSGLGASFVASQTTATLVAMTFNFMLNNVLTYSDRRLRGWGWLRGWVSFTLVCSVGALANVGIAAYLFERGTFWLASGLAGIVVGAVWNYAASAAYTWKDPS